MAHLIALLVCLGGACAVLSFYFIKFRKQIDHVQEQRLKLIKEKQMVVEFIHDLGDAIVVEATQAVLLKKMIAATVRIMAARSGAIFLSDAKKEYLTALAIEGLFPPPVPPPDFMEGKVASRSIYLEQVVMAQKVPIDDNFLGSVVRSGKPVLVTAEKRVQGLPEYEEEVLQIRSMMIVPLQFRGESLGVTKRGTSCSTSTSSPCSKP
jgi:hypothetical protein